MKRNGLSEACDNIQVFVWAFADRTGCTYANDEGYKYRVHVIRGDLAGTSNYVHDGDQLNLPRITLVVFQDEISIPRILTSIDIC